MFRGRTSRGVIIGSIGPLCIAPLCRPPLIKHQRPSKFLPSSISIPSSLSLSNIHHRKNAWENSGAKDALANAQSNLPQGTQDTLTLAKQRIFNRQNLRSPTVFFGIGEEQPFYVEKVPSLLTERLRHNLKFFYLNYAAVTMFLFCLTLLISPSAIIGMGLLGFAWMAVIRATSEGSMQVKGKFWGGGYGPFMYLKQYFI